MARKTAVHPDATPADTLPGVTLSSVIPAVLSEAVEGHRWQNRMTRADVMKEALTEWADARALIEDARARVNASITDDE